MAMTQNPPPKSRWHRFKSYFGTKKEEDYGESFYSQASELSDQSEIEITAADIMKSRQKDFINVVKCTIGAIL